MSGRHEYGGKRKDNNDGILRIFYGSNSSLGKGAMAHWEEIQSRGEFNVK
jgi:hypothetical protein